MASGLDSFPTSKTALAKNSIYSTCLVAESQSNLMTLWSENSTRLQQFPAIRQQVNLPSVKSLLWSEREPDKALITRATLENKVKGVLMKY